MTSQNLYPQESSNSNGKMAQINYYKGISNDNDNRVLLQSPTVNVYTTISTELNSVPLNSSLKSNETHSIPHPNLESPLSRDVSATSAQSCVDEDSRCSNERSTPAGASSPSELVRKSSNSGEESRTKSSLPQTEMRGGHEVMQHYESVQGMNNAGIALEKHTHPEMVPHIGNDNRIASTMTQVNSISTGNNANEQYLPRVLVVQHPTGFQNQYRPPLHANTLTNAVDAVDSSNSTYSRSNADNTHNHNGTYQHDNATQQLYTQQQQQIMSQSNDNQEMTTRVVPVEQYHLAPPPSPPPQQITMQQIEAQQHYQNYVSQQYQHQTQQLQYQEQNQALQQQHHLHGGNHQVKAPIEANTPETMKRKSRFTVLNQGEPVTAKNNQNLDDFRRVPQQSHQDSGNRISAENIHPQILNYHSQQMHDSTQYNSQPTQQNSNLPEVHSRMQSVAQAQMYKQEEQVQSHRYSESAHPIVLETIQGHYVSGPSNLQTHQVVPSTHYHDPKRLPYQQQSHNPAPGETYQQSNLSRTRSEDLPDMKHGQHHYQVRQFRPQSEGVIDTNHVYMESQSGNSFPIRSEMYVTGYSSAEGLNQSNATLSGQMITLQNQASYSNIVHGDTSPITHYQSSAPQRLQASEEIITTENNSQSAPASHLSFPQLGQSNGVNQRRTDPRSSSSTIGMAHNNVVASNPVVRIIAPVIKKKKGRFQFIEGTPITATATTSASEDQIEGKDVGSITVGSAPAGLQNQAVSVTKGRFVLTNVVEPETPQYSRVKHTNVQLAHLDNNVSTIWMGNAALENGGQIQESRARQSEMDTNALDGPLKFAGSQSNEGGSVVGQHIPEATNPDGEALNTLSLPHISAAQDDEAKNRFAQAKIDGTPLRLLSTKDDTAPKQEQLRDTSASRQITHRKSMSQASSIPTGANGAQVTKSSFPTQPAGVGKALYFLDQMRVELNDVDKANKSLQVENKCLKEKNKELEMKARDMERKFNTERVQREKAEAKIKELKNKLRSLKERSNVVEVDTKDHHPGGKVSRSSSFDGESDHIEKSVTGDITKKPALEITPVISADSDRKAASETVSVCKPPNPPVIQKKGLPAALGTTRPQKVVPKNPSSTSPSVVTSKKTIGSSVPVLKPEAKFPNIGIAGASFDSNGSNQTSPKQKAGKGQNLLDSAIRGNTEQLGVPPRPNKSLQDNSIHVPGSSMTRNFFDPLGSTTSMDRSSNESTMVSTEGPLDNLYSVIPRDGDETQSPSPPVGTPITSNDLISFQGDIMPFVSSSRSLNPLHSDISKDGPQLLNSVSQASTMSGWQSVQYAPSSVLTSENTQQSHSVSTMYPSLTHHPGSGSDFGDSACHSRNPSLTQLNPTSNQSWASSPSHQGSLDHIYTDAIPTDDILALPSKEQLRLNVDLLSLDHTHPGGSSSTSSERTNEVFINVSTSLLPVDPFDEIVQRSSSQNM